MTPFIIAGGIWILLLTWLVLFLRMHLIRIVKAVNRVLDSHERRFDNLYRQVAPLVSLGEGNER